MRAFALTLAASLIAAPTASAEIVSKLPGPGGLPFPAGFVHASTDGRYVLLSVGVQQDTPDATGPEADPESIGRWAIRDRVADTTTPVQFRVAPGARAFFAEPVQISDDGDRVLIRGNDPALQAFAGVTGQYTRGTAIYDRSEDRLLKIPTTPTVPNFSDRAAQLSSDGQRVLVLTSPPSGASNVLSLYRGPVGGAGSLVLSLPNLTLGGVSRDLETIVYSRALQNVPRPVPEYPRRESFSSTAIGIAVGNQPPRVLAEGWLAEERDPSVSECSGDTGVKTTAAAVGYGFVSASGARAGWRSYGPGSTFALTSRSPSGTISNLPLDPAVDPTVGAFGEANQTLIPHRTDGSALDLHEQFVKGDTELIHSGRARAGSQAAGYATRYVIADAYSGAPAPPVTPTTFSDEPVDTADRKSKVTWYACPAPPLTAPIGTIDQYLPTLSVTQPSSIKYSLGSTSVILAPSQSLRAATKVTAEVTLFGFTYWRATTTRSTVINFPKPLWGLPMTLKLTVQPAGSPAPKPLTRSFSIFTTKTN